MKYRISSGSNIRFIAHLPYLIFLLLLFLGVYFKPVLLNYQGPSDSNRANLELWDNMIREEHPELNWQNNISSGFPLFGQKGVDLFLADLVGKVLPQDSLNLLFLFLGGLGVYFIFIFMKYPPQIALVSAVIFNFSFFFFPFYVSGRYDIIRAISTLPWILFLTLYLEKRRSLLGCGLLALILIMAHKNIIPGLSLSILGLSILFWFFMLIRSVVLRSIVKFLVFSLLFFLAHLTALSAVSYPFFYLLELTRYTVVDLLGISLIDLLIIYSYLLVLFIWEIFTGFCINKIEDEDTALFGHIRTSVILGVLALAVLLVLRYLFDITIIHFNIIIIFVTFLMHGLLIILHKKNLFSRNVFYLLLLVSIVICLFFSLQEDLLRTAASTEGTLEYEMTYADEYFAEDMETARIYPPGKYFTENRWGKFNQTIGGRYYYGLARYNEVLQHCLNTELENRIPLNWNIIDMLNVKYLIYSEKIHTDNLAYSYYDLEQKLIIYKNLTYLPRAWFVDRVAYLETETEILKELNNGEFDPSVTAIVETSLNLSSAMNESVSLDSISAEYLQLTTRNDSTSFLVISEIYYPGNSSWKAYIDSSEVPIYAANHILRGLVVPAGEHKIVMEYQLRELPTLLLMNLLSLCLVMFIILLGIYHYIRKNYKGEIIYVIKK